MGAKTKEGLDGEKVIQFSVFLENKVGRLLDLVRMLEQSGIQILALSIVDTSECSVDRIIVNDPDSTRQLFRETGVSFVETPVVVVAMTGASDFKHVLAALLQGECNVQFAYPLLSRPYDKVCLVLFLEDNDCGLAILQAKGFKTMTQADLSR